MYLLQTWSYAEIKLPYSRLCIALNAILRFWVPFQHCSACWLKNIPCFHYVELIYWVQSNDVSLNPLSLSSGGRGWSSPSSSLVFFWPAWLFPFTRLAAGLWRPASLSGGIIPTYRYGTSTEPLHAPQKLGNPGNGAPYRRTPRRKSGLRPTEGRHRRARLRSESTVIGQKKNILHAPSVVVTNLRQWGMFCYITSNISSDTSRSFWQLFGGWLWILVLSRRV